MKHTYTIAFKVLSLLLTAGMTLSSCDSNVTPIEEKQEVTLSYVRIEKKNNRYEPVCLLTNNTDTSYTYASYFTWKNDEGKHSSPDYRWNSLINGKWEFCPWIDDNFGSSIDTIYPGDKIYMDFDSYSSLHDTNSTAMVVYIFITPTIKHEGFSLIASDTILLQ